MPARIYTCFKILLFGLIVIEACRKDKEEVSTPNTTPATLVLTSYPLTIGNTWEYHTESTLKDSTGFTVDSSKYENFWTVISDTTINGIASTKISQLDSNYDGSKHYAATYYANNPDGFFGMAADNSGSMFYLKAGLPKIVTPAVGDFGFMSPDTVFVPDTALQFLKYPSANNVTWRSHEYGSQFVIKRRWIGNTNVSTTAGTFNCIKLQVFWDADDDGIPDTGKLSIFQYFSVKGLIKETRFGTVSFSGGSSLILNQTSILVRLNF